MLFGFRKLLLSFAWCIGCILLAVLDFTAIAERVVVLMFIASFIESGQLLFALLHGWSFTLDTQTVLKAGSQPRSFLVTNTVLLAESHSFWKFNKL